MPNQILAVAKVGQFQIGGYKLVFGLWPNQSCVTSQTRAKRWSLDASM